MTRRLAWAFWFLPLRFQQALIAETYEQWIKRARFQPGLLGELIAVLPRARLLQHGGDQFARLSRVVRLACHRYNVNICRVYCQTIEPRAFHDVRCFGNQAGSVVGEKSPHTHNPAEAAPGEAAGS